MDEQAALDTCLVHVGRQAIFDAAGAVVGYELLFRDNADATRAAASGAYATSRVLVNACTEFGLARLGGGRSVFVNLTREFLVGELPLPFGPGEAVLEILETVPVDADVVAGVRDLVRRGYEVALDDFIPGTPADQLLEYATYVKIDTLGVDPEQLAATVAALPPRSGRHLVAERLETAQDLETARALGFTLFQGYLFARPEVVTGQRLNPSRFRTLRLLGALSDPEASVDEIATLVSADPALGYRLLTLANSAAASQHQVHSLRDAAILVGTRRLRQWLTLMSVADLAGDEDRAASVLIQARFCHEIAVQAGLPGDAAFTVGLIDAVCALIGEGRRSVTAHVPLAPDLTTALTTGHGPLGQVLATARAYRRHHPDDASTGRLTGAYLAAVAWTHDLATA